MNFILINKIVERKLLPVRVWHLHMLSLHPKIKGGKNPHYWIVSNLCLPLNCDDIFITGQTDRETTHSDLIFELLCLLA